MIKDPEKLHNPKSTKQIKAGWGWNRRLISGGTKSTKSTRTKEYQRDTKKYRWNRLADKIEKRAKLQIAHNLDENRTQDWVQYISWLDSIIKSSFGQISF